MASVAPMFNLPKTGNKIVNGNGRLLHFRVDWKGFDSAKCVLFNIMGYSAHTSRPEVTKLGNIMNQNGVVVITLDLQGHGHSDGERCYIRHHESFVRDIVYFITCVMDERSPDTRISFDKRSESFKHDSLPALRKLPFFVMGSSMGGGMSVLAGIAIHKQKHRFPNFQGVIFLAPFLTIARPGCITLMVLKSTVGTFCPAAQIPPWVSNENVTELLFKGKENLDYWQQDTWGNPGALGWNLPMRWGSALMFMDLGAAIDKSVSQVAYPFLVLQDPGDKITELAGATKFVHNSATPEELKSLTEMPGALHAVMANEPEKVCELALQWMDKMIQHFKENTPA